MLLTCIITIKIIYMYNVWHRCRVTVALRLFLSLFIVHFLEIMRQLILMSFSSARLGLMHIGVFILLLLSGERNFGRYI